MKNNTARIQILNVDQEVKEKGETRARKIGMSLQDVIRVMIYNYSEGKLDLGVVPSNDRVEYIDEDYENQLLNALKDLRSEIAEGRSKGYESGADLINSLKLKSNETNSVNKIIREKPQ